MIETEPDVQIRLSMDAILHKLTAQAESTMRANGCLLDAYSLYGSARVRLPVDQEDPIHQVTLDILTLAVREINSQIINKEMRRLANRVLDSI